MIIRDEQPADIEAIFRLTVEAFKNHRFGNHTEQFINDALRAAGALTLSLVAVDEGGGIVGHVAFSPVTVSDGSENWYGLGPISVAPERQRQRQGIGSALVREGLARLRAFGASGCVLLGDPAYYGRFGFVNHHDLILEGVPAIYFMALPFEEHVTPRGTVVFHPAFSATG